MKNKRKPKVKHDKDVLKKEVFMLYHEKGMSIEELASRFDNSTRTIWRWIAEVKQALRQAERAGVAEGVLWGQFILARVHLARGELGAARQVAGKGRDYASRLEVYEGKPQWFAAIEAQTRLLEGEVRLCC